MMCTGSVHKVQGDNVSSGDTEIFIQYEFTCGYRTPPPIETAVASLMIRGVGEEPNHVDSMIVDVKCPRTTANA